MRKSLIAIFVGCVAAGFATEAQAKKNRPVEPATIEKTTPASKPTTQPATKTDEVETGKARARELENGKPLDKAKTGEKINVLTGQVNDLEVALRKQSPATPTTETPMAATGRKKGRKAAATQPTTQPATQPAPKKAKADQ